MFIFSSYYVDVIGHIVFWVIIPLLSYWFGGWRSAALSFFCVLIPVACLREALRYRPDDVMAAIIGTWAAGAICYWIHYKKTGSFD